MRSKLGKCVTLTDRERGISASYSMGPQKCRHLIHDRDNCFLPFDEIVKAQDIDVVKTPPRSPRCNAFAERHVRECRETLDNMILCGQEHLHYVVKKIERHHNRYRPHQGIGNAIPLAFEYPGKPATTAEVRCELTLGGLLNHYHVCKAA